MSTVAPPRLFNEMDTGEQVLTVLQTLDEAEQAIQALEAEIRTLAYQKWEEAGRPEGDGVQFWVEAESEIKQQQCSK